MRLYHGSIIQDLDVLYPANCGGRDDMAIYTTPHKHIAAAFAIHWTCFKGIYMIEDNLCVGIDTPDKWLLDLPCSIYEFEVNRNKDVVYREFHLRTISVDIIEYVTEYEFLLKLAMFPLKEHKYDSVMECFSLHNINVVID